MSLLTQVLRPSSSPNVLQVTGLTGGPESLVLFHHIDFCIPPGVSALVGDEGVGKTSLLRLLAGDLPASQGQMRVFGNLVPLSTPQPATVFWCDLRLPIHDHDTPETCWGLWRQQLPAWSNELQSKLIHDLRLTPHLGKRLNMLSTGSRRKIGLVAALASGATVTLIDQAFVSLDQSAVRVIEQALRQASHHPTQACLIAGYETPRDVPLSSVLTLT